MGCVEELLVEAGRSYLDRYTDIEAATNPLILCIDNTGVSVAKPQVALNKSLNSRYVVWLMIFVSFLSADSYVMGFWQAGLAAT